MSACSREGCDHKQADLCSILINGSHVASPPTWFQELRHIEKIIGVKEELAERDLWRKFSKERMKTVSVALVLCLNIGVDPPDVQKPNICAKKECWIDPSGMNPQKALTKISSALQKNYERWQPRARYRTANDPTVDDVRRLCQSIRRNAKDERILFHYNGHGVPRPTENGEIWVFNKNFTQYIPLSIFDLQTWMGHPAVYVWDCHSAGLIVKSFCRFADDQEKEWVKELDELMETHPPPLPMIRVEMSLDEKAKAFGFRKQPNFKECIHLAACADDELLPMDTNLPADLFTSCLTTPIQTSILCYILKHDLQERYPLSIVEKIPGQLTDRRTLLGELNWIFTAITDTIAWSSLPKDVFQKLFRLDLLLASLFRSFILADRIMRDNQCHVVSRPVLPSVYDHPLWDAWDYTIDLCLNQLVGNNKKNKLWMVGKELCFANSSARNEMLIDVSVQLIKNDEFDYTHNWFFIDQLQAFEVWLKYGGERREPPQQLPVVLQVLLSQVHRVKALELLARFLDLGSWAVGHALSVGIFPYVLKLLQSATKELRPWLSFIWAKILAVETSCQVDLIKDRERGYMYFLTILNDPNTNPRQKIVPAFVTAALIENNYRPAQESLTENRYVTLCIELLADPASQHFQLLKLWLLIGLGRLWADYDDARWQAIRLVAYERVLEFLDDSVPEVRAAAVYAIGCLVRNRSEDNEHAATIDHEVCDKLTSKCTYDGSVLVRAELVAAIQWFIIDFRSRFATLSMDLSEKIENIESSSSDNRRKHSAGEQEIDSMLSVAEERDDVHEYYDRTLPRLSTHRRVRAFIKDAPKRSNSINFGGVLSDTVYAHWKSSCDVVSTHDFSVTSKKSLSEDNFKLRAQKQSQFLESKTFKDQPERIWLSLLRLSLDPVEKIAQMAQASSFYHECSAFSLHRMPKRKFFSCIHCLYFIDSRLQVLIRHVEKLANSIHERKRKLSYVEKSFTTRKDSVNSSSDIEVGKIQPVTFTVGSPTADISSPSQNVPNGRIMNNSERTSFRKDSIALPVIQLSGAFTPKRNMYSPTINNLAKLHKENTVKEPAEALILTEFVQWCTKKFTEPILDMIYGLDADGDSDRSSIYSVPSDWAYNKEEGLQQISKIEVDAFKKKRLVCDVQTLNTKTEQRVSCMAWSQIRPHLYVCDMDRINVWHLEKQRSQIVRAWSFNDKNPYVDDCASDLFVLNGMTRELLMSGSNDATLRFWDPGYSVHSCEFDLEPRLVSAVCILKEVPRLSSLNPLTTVYSWSQCTGKVVVSGNVRICRIWDAHSEKIAQDIQISSKNSHVTSLSAENCTNQLIAVGLNDGSVYIYDPRLPKKSQRIMSSNKLEEAVVGLSFLWNGGTEVANGDLKLVVGANNGEICVWEPRMFQEPVANFNVCTPKLSGGNEQLNIVEVHKGVQLIACSTSSCTIKLFDICGKQFNELKNDDASNVPVQTMRFHEMLLTLAASTAGRNLNVYAMSDRLFGAYQ